MLLGLLDRTDPNTPQDAAALRCFQVERKKEVPKKDSSAILPETVLGTSSFSNRPHPPPPPPISRRAWLSHRSRPPTPTPIPASPAKLEKSEEASVDSDPTKETAAKALAHSRARGGVGGVLLRMPPLAKAQLEGGLLPLRDSVPSPQRKSAASSWPSSWSENVLLPQPFEPRARLCSSPSSDFRRSVAELLVLPLPVIACFFGFSVTVFCF